MNEDHNINLPPDADDLSRHAPALFALKGTETGLVVPELYFEELSERVISRTAIPEDGGLVLPENYFGALTEIVEAKTALPGESGLIVPENYFEESASIIEAKVTLPSESGLTEPENYFSELSASVETHLMLESKLPKAETDIPENYFPELENELHVHIALDNLRQDEGFVVPEEYFEGFTQKILRTTTADIGADQNDPNVPEGYFEELPDKVIAVINSEMSKQSGIVRPLSWTREHWRPVAAAASVALLLVMGWMFMNTIAEGTGELRVANYSPVTPEKMPDVVPLTPDTLQDVNETTLVVAELPKKREGIKPNPVREVLMNDDEIGVQLGQMDESLVIEFVTENEEIEPAEEVLNAEMIEYLMNDNTGLEVFDPGE